MIYNDFGIGPINNISKLIHNVLSLLNYNIYSVFFKGKMNSIMLALVNNIK